jgi:ribonuclease G
VTGWTVDIGPAEWRAEQVLDKGMVAWHVWRPHWSRLLPGDVVEARLRTMTGLLDIDGEDVLLRPIPPGLHEGQRLTVRITRARLPEPGRWKPAQAQVTDLPVLPAGDLLERWLALTGAQVGQAGVVEPEVAWEKPLSGGLLTIQRTRAGVVADVDGTGDPRSLNAAAACAWAQLLCAWQIGGSVLIDFVGMPDKAARLAVAEAFDGCGRADPRPSERTAINGFGLMQVVRARTMPSVLDVWLGTNIVAESAETQAIALLGQAARTPGAGPRGLVVSQSVFAALEPLGHAIHAVARNLGAPLELRVDPQLTTGGHVHVAHP